MSPCHEPSGLRRITLTTPSSFALSELLAEPIGGEFMRHGAQQAVNVGDKREAVHDAIQIRLGHFHRHADAVVAPGLKAAGQALGGLHGSDRIAQDRVQPRLTA